MRAKTKAQLLAEIEALQKRIAELQAIKAESHQKNGIFKKQAHALGERVKELDCLYSISHLVETPDISLAEIIQGCVELLPPAWQYPQITCARITLDNQENKTDNFRETEWKLVSEIKVGGKREGAVEVFYLEEQPEDYEGPFLKEERALIDVVAERLGKIIQRVGAQERIEHLNLVLRAIRDVNQLIVREKNRGKLIREVCSTLTESRGYSTAWIMLFNERGKYSDSAESGLGKGFTPLLKELKCGNFPACVQLPQLRSGLVEIIDPSMTCADCPIADIYSDMGRITVWLKHAEKVYGVLSVSYGIDITVNEEELSLFKEIAGDIAFALYNIKLDEGSYQTKTRFRLAASAGSDLIYEWDLESNNLEWFGGIDENLGYKPGTIPRTIEGWVNLIHPDDLERLKDSVEHHRISTEQINEEYRVRDKKGNWRHWVDRGLPVLDKEGKPFKWIGACMDITEQVQAQQEIETLLALSRQAGTETNLEDLLFFIAGQIVEVIPPAQTASVFMCDEKRKIIKVQAWAGFTDSEIKGLEFEVNGSQAGELFHTKEPALIKDVSEDPNFKPLDGPNISKIKSQIAVPLIFKERIIGIIFADNLTRTNAFSQKHLDLLESIGNQLAGVIENAHLLDQVMEKHKQLRQSEEQYQSVVEDSPGLINRFTPDGTITFASQDYCKFFGKKYDELIGMNIQTTIVEEDREKVMSSIASLTKESPVRTFENNVIRHDGEIRWMRWIDRALFDHKGQAISYQSFGEDITERKWAEENLKISEERFRAFMENVPAFAYILNKDLKHIYGNPASIAADGYSSLDGYIGTSIRDSYPDEISDEIEANSKRVLSEGCVTHHEFSATMPDGKSPTLFDCGFKLLVQQDY